MRDFVADVDAAVRPVRWTAGAIVAAFVSFTLAVAAAVAVLGLFRVTGVRPLRLTASIALQAIPFVDWLGQWSPLLRTPARMQADGLTDVLRVVVGLGVLVFAIGTVQAAIALVARAYARRHEIALRAALGAPRRRLLGHFLVEGSIFAVAAVGTACWLGWTALRVLRLEWPGRLVGDATTDVPVLLPVAASAAAVAIVLFLRPALRMSRRGWIMDAVAPHARSNPGTLRVDTYRMLVVAQLASALTLLTGAGLVYRHSGPGSIDAQTRPVPAGRLVLPLDASALAEPRRAGGYEGVARRLAASPGVATSAIASPGAVVGLGPVDRLTVECGRCAFGGMALPVWSVFAEVHAVGPGFFDTLGVSVLEGKEFRRGEQAAGSVVVNRTMVERGFQGHSPLGKRIQVGGLTGRSYKVIGVVEDIRRAGIARRGEAEGGVGAAPYETTAAPAVYLSALERPPAVVDLVVRTSGPPGQVARDLPHALAGLGVRPGHPGTLEQVVREAEAPERWFATTAAILACLALLIAAHGLHGLMHFTVALRRGEIGIRRAVGATRRAIVAMILAESIGIVLRGTALGLVGSVLLARTLRVLFAGLPTLDPAVSAGAALVLGVAALVGAVVPARTAARLDPAVAVMHE